MQYYSNQYDSHTSTAQRPKPEIVVLNSSWRDQLQRVDKTVYIYLFYKKIIQYYKKKSSHYQGNTIYRPSVGPRLGKHRRQWWNIGSTMGRCFVLA